MDQNNQPQQPSNEPVAPPQPLQQNQPQQPAQPQYNHENPGQTLGVISVILSYIGLSLVGLILGIISRKKSKEAGAPTVLGTLGMWLGIVVTVLSTLAFVFFLVVSVAGFQNYANEKNSNFESSISE